MARESKVVYDKIREMIREGKSTQEICSKLNVLESQVAYQRKKLVKENGAKEVLNELDDSKLLIKSKKTKTNLELIKDKVEKEGLKLNSYSKSMDKLPAKEIKRVVDTIGYGSSSTVYMNFNNIDYIVEVSEVDDEVDVWLMTRAEYENQYGEIYEEDWEWGLY